jgi:Fe-S-cluster-containing dehydrogenase component
MKTIMSLEKAFKCTLMCGEKQIPTCVVSCDRDALVFEDLRAHKNAIRRKKIKEIPHK